MLVFFYICRFCRNSGVSVPRGVEKGPIWQASGHMGMWSVLKFSDSHFLADLFSPFLLDMGSLEHYHVFHNSSDFAIFKQQLHVTFL